MCVLLLSMKRDFVKGMKKCENVYFVAKWVKFLHKRVEIREGDQRESSERESPEREGNQREGDQRGEDQRKESPLVCGLVLFL